MWDLVITILVGAVIGWLAGCIMKSKGGVIVNILVGIGGSFLGGWVAGLLGIGGGFLVSSILIPLGGACLLIFLLRLLFGKK